MEVYVIGNGSGKVFHTFLCSTRIRLMDSEGRKVVPLTTALRMGFRLCGTCYSILRRKYPEKLQAIRDAAAELKVDFIK